MGKARDTATDRLSNVIEVVELGRRTGMLSAERGAGPGYEEGEIYFVGGRAVYAVHAQLRGREALGALGQWGVCRFCFETQVRAPLPNITEPMSTPGSQIARAGPTGPTSGGSGFGWPSGPLGGSAPGVPMRGDNTARDSRAAATPGAVPGVAQSTGPLARRPRRAPDMRDLMTVVTTHNLSRGHRAILLLADGHHNILDIARLASKTVDEVTQLITDLQTRGLIYFYE
jgi:hypothetical protein